MPRPISSYLRPSLAGLLAVVILLGYAAWTQRDQPDQGIQNAPPNQENLQPSRETAFSKAELRQLTYRTLSGQDIALHDGSATYSTEQGSGSLSIAEKGVAFGDLNGDGSEDAVVPLADNGGSNLYSYYLAAVLNDQGKPEVAAYSDVLGKGLTIQDAFIADGRIAIQALAVPDGQECCASLPANFAYRLRGNRLLPLK